MSEIKLLPCPFCGSTNVAQGASRGSISVWCFCGSQGPSVPFPDECIDPVVPILKCHEAWNRRSTLSDAVAEREAELVAVVVGHHVVQGPNVEFLTDNLDVGTKLYVTPPTSELEALRKRVAEIDAHRRKVLAENVRLLNALIERDRRVAELEKAVDGLLAPFEHDECRKDHHGYCQAHFLEEECCVATARRVREGGKVDGSRK